MKLGKKISAVALLAAGLVLVIYLANSLAGRVDLTAEHTYSLSDGSKNLLKKLEEPVTLKLYYSHSFKGLPVWFKNFESRVEELLREYASASHGKVKVVVIDPKPDTKEEEAATRAGLTGQPLDQGDRHPSARLELHARVGAREERHAGQVVRRVVVPVRNRSAGELDFAERAIDARHELGDRPEVRMRLQPALERRHQ